MLRTWPPDLLRRIGLAYGDLAAPAIAVAVTQVGIGDDLLPEEIPYIARATEARRLEFAAGRWCARRALERVGGPLAAIPRGCLYQPIWPVGFAGSITHDGGLAAAVAYRLAPSSRPHIGIDLLDCSDLSRFAEIGPVILSDRDRLAPGRRIDARFAVAQAFSAKEASIKILSNALGRFIEFTEISVSAGADGFVLAHPEAGTTLSSRSREVGPFLVTLATAHTGQARP